jgi:hypothetical protein
MREIARIEGDAAEIPEVADLAGRPLNESESLATCIGEREGFDAVPAQLIVDAAEPEPGGPGRRIAPPYLGMQVADLGHPQKVADGGGIPGSREP